MTAQWFQIRCANRNRSRNFSRSRFRQLLVLPVVSLLFLFGGAAYSM
jgi:hypothetical protein